MLHPQCPAQKGFPTKQGLLMGRGQSSAPRPSAQHRLAGRWWMTVGGWHGPTAPWAHHQRLCLTVLAPPGIWMCPSSVSTPAHTTRLPHVHSYHLCCQASVTHRQPTAGSGTWWLPLALQPHPAPSSVHGESGSRSPRPPLAIRLTVPSVGQTRSRNRALGTGPGTAPLGHPLPGRKPPPESGG